jgi:hypothetical protein
MKWIKVEDKLPNAEQLVIAYPCAAPYKCDIYPLIYFRKEFHYIDSNGPYNATLYKAHGITHWMELPDPPTNLLPELNELVIEQVTDQAFYDALSQYED